MPIIIVGIRSRVVEDGLATPETAVCHYCRQPVTLQPVRLRRYFTLFFVPLLPLGKGEAALRCPNCKTMFQRRQPGR